MTRHCQNKQKLNNALYFLIVASVLLFFTGCGKSNHSVRTNTKVVFVQSTPTATLMGIEQEVLRKAMQESCDKLNAEGYEIISAVPIIRGQLDKGYFDHSIASNYGLGFSHTDGIMLIATR